MGLTGQSRLAGIIGWPVAYSRSPRLHNHWLARHGVDGAYVPLPVQPGRLVAAVRGLQATGFVGANVTLPFKVEVMALCDELSPAAHQIGAVNTLIFTPGGIIGDNTDGVGFLQNLRASATPGPGPALLLGAGGAARAVAAAFLNEGRAVIICNRTPGRAEALRDALPGLTLLPWEYRSAALAEAAVLVNTTSLGMTGKGDLVIDLVTARPDLVVVDIVYAPLITPLLQDAAARGHATVGGLGMLLHQAVPGFAAWFGVTPVVDSATVALMSGPG